MAKKKEVEKAPEAPKLGFDALFDQVVIKRDSGDKTTPSGIVLPEAAKRKTTAGVVVAVGPGRRTEQGEFIKTTVQVGWHVHFPEYGGQEVEIGDEKYLVIRETGVLLVETAK